MKILSFLILFYLVSFLDFSAQDSLTSKTSVVNSINNSNMKSTKFGGRFYLNNQKKISREFDYGFQNNNEKINILSPSLNKYHLKKKNNFIDSPWFLVVVGTAVSFGASAAYFKNKANEYDDAYKKNGGSQNYTERNKYDLYGGFALGALELNVGFLIYKFLTD